MTTVPSIVHVRRIPCAAEKSTFHRQRAFMLSCVVTLIAAVFVPVAQAGSGDKVALPTHASRFITSYISPNPAYVFYLRSPQ